MIPKQVILFTLGLVMLRIGFSYWLSPIDWQNKNSVSYNNQTKSYLLNFYQKSLHEAYSGLIVGMVLGEKSAISPVFWKQLTSSGLSHIVVASGTNINLVYAFVFGIFCGFIRRKYTMCLGLVAIWSYVLLIGVSPPILRAAVMTSIVILVGIFDRPNYGISILYFTAISFILLWPWWIGNLSFILSFLSTLGMVMSTRLEKVLDRFLPDFLGSSLSLTFSAQLFTLPVIYYYFGRVSWWGPISNLLVGPVVGLITIVGMISGIISFAIPRLGVMVLYLLTPFLQYFVMVVELFH